MQNMTNNPDFLQHMSSLFSNPQVIEQIAAMNPAGLDPQMRQMFQSEQFRQMLCV